MKYEGVPVETAKAIFRYAVAHPALQDAIVPYSVPFVSHPNSVPGTGVFIPPAVPTEGPYHIGGLKGIGRTHFQRLREISSQLSTDLDNIRFQDAPHLALCLPLRFDYRHSTGPIEQPAHFTHGFHLEYFDSHITHVPPHWPDEEPVGPIEKITPGYLQLNLLPANKDLFLRADQAVLTALEDYIRKNVP